MEWPGCAMRGRAYDLKVPQRSPPLMRNAFYNREQAEENVYFAQRDARLIERLRARAKLGDIAAALADKLHVDNPDLLQRIVNLGVTSETAAAFLVAPLIDVAWADGHVGPAEYNAVMTLAAERGVAHDSTDMNQIKKWLEHRPPRDLVEAAIDAVKVGLSVLPADERHRRIEQVIHACEAVARSGGTPGGAPLVVMSGNLSQQEMAVLGHIRARLAG
jgi:hypothetical protein